MVHVAAFTVSALERTTVALERTTVALDRTRVSVGMKLWQLTSTGAFDLLSWPRVRSIM